MNLLRAVTLSKLAATSCSCRPPSSSQGNRNKAGPTVLQVKELQVDGIRGTFNTEGSLTFSPPCSIRLEIPVFLPQPVSASLHYSDCRGELL